MTPARLASALLLTAIVASSPGEAHKPITSPYTYSEHVFPILQRHCGACHVAGGVAPMSLLTHAETVPWGESIRLELIAARMPPFAATSGAGRLAHSAGLSARELDTLMTWASGGTPPGAGLATPPPATATPDWPLGRPDWIRTVEFTLPAEVQETEWVETIPPVIDGPATAYRAVDIRPGNAALVRSATVAFKDGPTLLEWQPGDQPTSVDGAAFVANRGRSIEVRIRYRKTWQHEREVMRDRTAIGFYNAIPGVPAVESLAVTKAGTVVDRNLRVLAIRPDRSAAGTTLELAAVRPDGVTTELIRFTPAAGWVRRYWFETPVDLPRGTRLALSASDSADAAPTLILDVVASRP